MVIDGSRVKSRNVLCGDEMDRIEFDSLSKAFALSCLDCMVDALMCCTMN